MLLLPFLHCFIPQHVTVHKLKTEGEDPSFPIRLVSRVWSEPLLLFFLSFFSLHLIQACGHRHCQGKYMAEQGKQCPSFLARGPKEEPQGTGRYQRDRSQKRKSSESNSINLWTPGLTCKLYISGSDCK